ncbi:MAG: DUF6065 family protein [Planctomycetota bacterium]
MPEHDTTPRPRDGAVDLPLTAYEAASTPCVDLRPAPHQRAWMDATVDAFAYRCLPLVMANQLGWEALSPVTFKATWNGGPEASDIAITFDGETSPFIDSHFGHGLLTFKTGYHFRTPPGHNLWVKGPANRPKDGIAPLEGLVEADWGPFTFTMNWRFTRAHHEVTFEEGEPFMGLMPLPRGYPQRFAPRIRPLAADPELQRQFLAWRDARNVFNEEFDIPGSRANEARWQKHYMQGTSPMGERLGGHERRLDLRPFVREDATEST